VSDIVKRLHRRIILIGIVGNDPDLKLMLEEAKAEIIKLREERDALLESQMWSVNCKPEPAGPEGDG